MYHIASWLAMLLFCLGIVGFIVRRNAIVMVICSELALQGGLLNLVIAAARHHDYGGQVLAIFIITIAACEAALALVLILRMYRRKVSLDISAWDDLGEELVSSETRISSGEIKTSK